jgi:trypsin
MLARRLLAMGILGTLTILAGAMPAAGNHPANPLQPGDIVNGPVGQCTLNFVFDGQGSLAGNVYFGIAAHCVEPGNVMSSTGYAAFGTAVYDDDAFTDFALIQVNTAVVPHVSSTVKGHPGLPTGVTSFAETNVGDTLKFSGYGLGFSSTSVTQERRVGVLISDNASTYCAEGPILFGDSGGPVLHGPTGKALGIVSALSISLVSCSPTGPTVQASLNRASLDGFPIALRTGT